MLVMMSLELSGRQTTLPARLTECSARIHRTALKVPIPFANSTTQHTIDTVPDGVLHMINTFALLLFLFSSHLPPPSPPPPIHHLPPPLSHSPPTPAPSFLTQTHLPLVLLRSCPPRPSCGHRPGNTKLRILLESGWKSLVCDLEIGMGIGAGMGMG